MNQVKTYMTNRQDFDFHGLNEIAREIMAYGEWDEEGISGILLENFGALYKAVRSASDAYGENDDDGVWLNVLYQMESVFNVDLGFHMPEVRNESG